MYVCVYCLPRRDVKERDAKIHRLSSELRSRTAECERLQKIVGQHQRVQDRLRKEVEYHMFSLRVSLTHTECIHVLQLGLQIAVYMFRPLSTVLGPMDTVSCDATLLLQNTIAGLKEENAHLRRYKDTHHEIQRGICTT